MSLSTYRTWSMSYLTPHAFISSLYKGFGQITSRVGVQNHPIQGTSGASMV